MRLHCDEMLRGLARWLRAAGHDATTARPGEADALVLAQAGAAGRALLTRDRGLMRHRAAAGLAVLLEGPTLDAQAAELRERLAVDWLHAPFSRCLVCNVPLRDAAPDLHDRLPLSASPLPGPLWECPSCGRLYWPGSHVRRMRHRLEGWARGVHGSSG
ncbi:Mut7-C RNAse domain-containing protein [Novispirillum sp. DQ9]|uniref:Mut7-C RNAse domain-containing protein n=1 Tax=Novispirillum sp. DQ9 TaxID=3398612 RepID=UPI003C7B8FF9